MAKAAGKRLPPIACPYRASRRLYKNRAGTLTRRIPLFQSDTLRTSASPVPTLHMDRARLRDNGRNPAIVTRLPNFGEALYALPCVSC